MIRKERLDGVEGMLLTDRVRSVGSILHTFPGGFIHDRSMLTDMKVTRLPAATARSASSQVFCAPRRGRRN